MVNKSNIKSKKKDKKKDNERKTNNKKDKKEKLKKTVKIKKIGKKLGEGSFGCVVTPPVMCKKRSKKIDMLDYNNNNYVSKLINIYSDLELDEMKREIKLNKIIYKLDTNNKYFVSFIKTCPIKMNTLKYRKDVEKIKASKIIGKSESDELCYVNKKTKNIIMMNAGVNIDDVLVYKIYSTMRSLMKIEIYNIFKHLLKGLQILHSNEIVHLDIKPENMSFSISKDGNYHIRYLDFGFSEIANKNKHKIHSYIFGTPGYMSPDMYILCKLKEYSSYIKIKDLVIKSNKDYIINKVKKSIKKNEFEHHENISLYKYYPQLTITRDILNNIYNKFTNELINNNIQNLFSEKINGLKYKYDIYALGITFHEIISELRIKDERLKELIIKMVEPNPYKRFNVDQCVKMINKIN